MLWHVVEILLPADDCYQFWLRLFLRGWRTPECSRDFAVSFSLGQVHEAILESLSLTSVGLCSETTASSFRIFLFLLLRPLTVNPFSPQPTPVFFYTVTVFCLFVRTLDFAVGRFKLLPQHWWKIPMKFFAVNKRLICWFSWSYIAFVCGPDIVCTNYRLNRKVWGSNIYFIPLLSL